MKLTTVVLLIFSLLVGVFLYGQESSAEQEYIKAMTTADVNQKAKMLKDYISKYAGKGTKYENFAYANLCLLPYSGKTPQETIEYGEKALALNGLDALTKCQVLLQVSGIYSSLGQNLDKAAEYAGQVVKIAQTNKNSENSGATPQQWNTFIGAAYFAQGQAMEKAKNYSGAVDVYIKSYGILKNKEIINSLKRAGKLLYDNDQFSSAQKAFEIPATSLKDFPSLVFYAKSLHRQGKNTEALKFYKEAYSQQKNGEVAYNIGIILASQAKSNPSKAQEAIDYLLQASFLSETFSKKAMQLSESLFFTQNPDLKYNETVNELAGKSKKLEELTNTFNSKFGDKTEEDLSESQKKEMNSLLDQIETEQKAIEKLQKAQEEALNKFNDLIEQTKKKLGIN